MRGRRGKEGGGLGWRDWGYSAHKPSSLFFFFFRFRFFFFFLDRSFSMQGYQGVWPIIGMQIAADGVPQQKKRTG